MKEFTVSASDLTDDAKFTCTLTGTSPDYGTVYVDENMNLIHAPAEADANDTLHLENCILSVETPGNDYELNGNILSVVRHRLNGSVTAEAWVYTAAPEKLVEFEYDSSGMRTQKKVTDHGQMVTTEYIYNGKKLVELTCGEDTLHFFYDAQKRPAKVKYNDKFYMYAHNLQGDIVGICCEEEKYILQCYFDPYGNPVSNGNAALTLVEKILGYRGYVFDDEIQMYYVHDRFYSARIGRFLNADIYILDKRVPVNMNQYIYCRNNPIMRHDPSGKASQSFISKLTDRLYLTMYFYLEAFLDAL